MTKISDEEMQEILAEKRHDELIASLGAIASRRGSDAAATEAVKLLAAIEKKELTVDLAPVVGELARGIEELKRALNAKPRGFTIERNKLGLIERIVPEYE